MLQLLNNIARRMAAPVKANFLFALITFAMLAEQPFNWISLSSNDTAHQIGLFFEGLGLLCGIVYLACCLCYFTRSRVVKGVLCVFNFALLAITLFLELNFQMNISQSTLTALVETNSAEATEFIDAYCWSPSTQLAAIYCGIVLATIILLCVFGRRIRRWVASLGITRPLEWAVSLLAFVGLCLALPAHAMLLLAGNSTQVYHWRSYFRHDALDIYTQSIHALVSVHAFSNDVELAREQARQVWRTQARITEPDSLTIIYVLGESYNKHHATIYGYPLLTTPTLSAEQQAGRLVVFTDAVAQENITSIVEKNTFSINSVGQGESWFDHPNFTTIFKRAGYRVYMWDMQRSFSPGQLFTITVNQFVYNPEIQRLSYTACNRSSFNYDMQLVDDFARTVSLDSARHNLVVFHLMGQHVDAARRMPPGSHWARHFTPDSIHRSEKWMTRAKKRAIADYDNATRYNDAVLARIFSLVRQRNAVVVYFSDHGDEVYDWTDRKGRHNGELTPNPNTLKYQFQVPFMVWCSPTYAARHPRIMQQLRAAARRPIMTDLVGQMMLHLGAIATPYYIPDRDYISPHFTPKPRILSDHLNYDETLKR